jgi:tRNA(fMet)-specific endonuclease VapC
MPGPGNLLLDSSIVIAHFRQDETVSEKIAAAGVLYLPAIALGELHHGARRSQNPARNLEQLHAFLAGIVVLPVDAATAVCYGGIKTALSQAGTPIPDNDAWIAALAHEYQLPLVTRDAHFDFVRGLTVLRW